MRRFLRITPNLLTLLSILFIWLSLAPSVFAQQSTSNTGNTNGSTNTNTNSTTSTADNSTSSQSTGTSNGSTTAPSAGSASSLTANGVCKGILSAETGTFDPNATAASCKETGETGLGVLVRRIINIFSIVVGAVAVIMVIIGGFRYIISGGDSSGVQGAKNTILYAIVGLVIVLFAQIIIRFVFTTVAPAAQ